MRQINLTLKVNSGDKGDIRVKLLLGILIIVTLTGDTDTNTVVSVLNTTRPDSLVQRGVKTNVLGTHSLLSKSLDSLDSMRSTLSQRATKDMLVHVDGVLTSDNISEGGTLLGGLLVLGHLFIIINISDQMDGYYILAVHTLKGWISKKEDPIYSAMSVISSIGLLQYHIWVRVGCQKKKGFALFFFFWFLKSGSDNSIVSPNIVSIQNLGKEVIDEMK